MDKIRAGKRRGLFWGQVSSVKTRGGKREQENGDTPLGKCSSELITEPTGTIDGKKGDRGKGGGVQKRWTVLCKGLGTTTAFSHPVGQSRWGRMGGRAK